MKTLRQRTYGVLSHPDPQDRSGRAIYGLVLALIVANVAASVLETVSSIEAAAGGFFLRFELVSVAVFTAEYLARLWACVEDPRYASRGRLAWVFSPMALVDLLAIAPFYLSLVAVVPLDLRFVRVLRLARVFRLLRVEALSQALHTLGNVTRKKRHELLISVFVVAMLVLLVSSIMYFIEHGEEGTAFTSIPAAMWWGIITVTTIGYGDMTPVTAVGKVFGGVVAFLGVCAFALPVGIISAGFINELEQEKEPAPAETRSSLCCPSCGAALALAMKPGKLPS
jgi:voltage-gated potassium channel